MSCCPFCDQDQQMQGAVQLQGLGLVGFGYLGNEGAKLVDEGGQGSSNASFGPIVQVTPQDELNYFQPSVNIAAGATVMNKTPLVRTSELVGAGVSALLFATGWKKLAAVALGATVLDLVTRQLSPNYDSMVSMLPLNTKVV